MKYQYQFLALEDGDLLSEDYAPAMTRRWGEGEWAVAGAATLANGVHVLIMQRPADVAKNDEWLF